MLVAGGLAPAAVVWGQTSCVLADPPPSLPIIAPQAPIPISNSIVPPADTFIANWPSDMPLEFNVPVEVLDPNLPLTSAVLLDYETAQCSVPTNLPNTSEDAGSIDVISFRLPRPVGSTCHTITLFLAARSIAQVSCSLSCDDLCTSVSWFWCPELPVFDAGPLPDAAADADTGFMLPDRSAG